MKYPTHPSGLGPQAAFAGPRDVWDISFGILSLEALPLGTKYRSISVGNGVIYLGFLYSSVNFT